MSGLLNPILISLSREIKIESCTSKPSYFTLVREYLKRRTYPAKKLFLRGEALELRYENYKKKDWRLFSLQSNERG